MFDVDEFIDECRQAVAETEPHRAVREVLERAMGQRAELMAALPATETELTTLHRSPELTVLKVVWGPHLSVPPHEHLMWAAIGIYGGREDNAFYRRAHRRVVPTGGKELRDGDVAVLGDDVVHSVANPLAACTGAIHVYGGDLFAPVRRSWDPETLEEVEGAFDPRTRLGN
jgi:predicted metal-dependent enzyme (double-stranded beta helix superfamily)